MPKQLTVLKLGGALLTDKSTPRSLRHDVLAAVVREIKVCLQRGLIEKLVLVHGVGSFGHPPVIEHQLHKGLRDPAQLLALTATQNVVMELRLAIAAAFHEAAVPVCLMLPSSCMTAAGFALKNSFLDAVGGFNDIGMVPLLGGDILPDSDVGFSVYGGDQMAVAIALHFGASRLIFASEVDGIHDRDPQKYEDTQRIERLSLATVARSGVVLDDHRQVDASGAMAGKLEAIKKAQAAMAGGMRTWLLSMMVYGNLLGVLEGAPGRGTEIVA